MTGSEGVGEEEVDKVEWASLNLVGNELVLVEAGMVEDNDEGALDVTPYPV